MPTEGTGAGPVWDVGTTHLHIANGAELVLHSETYGGLGLRCRHKPEPVLPVGEFQRSLQHPLKTGSCNACGNLINR